MGEARRLVKEQVLDDDQVEGPQRGFDMAGVGVGLGDVFALDIEPSERSAEGCIEHVRDPQARLGQ